MMTYKAGFLREAETSGLSLIEGHALPDDESCLVPEGWSAEAQA